MALKVKLVKSFSSSSERQLGTIIGLGLKGFGSEKILKDSPQVRGMLAKVAHLVAFEVVKTEPKTRLRMKPKKIRARDAARKTAETKGTKS
jgi:large subunit ribosomal protein L30